MIVCYPLVCLLLGTVAGSASWWREALMHLLAVAALAAAFHAGMRRERWPLVGGPFEPALALLFLALVAGALRAACPGRSWSMVALFAGAAAVFYLTRGAVIAPAGADGHIRAALFVATATAAAAALLGLLGYALGWTVRVAAPLGHHNYMAGFLLLHLPLGWGVARSAERAGRIFGYVAIVLMATAIVFTGSLAGVAVLAGLTMLAARAHVRARARARMLRRRTAMSAVLLALALAIAAGAGALLIRFSRNPIVSALRQRAAGIVSERRDPSLSLENRARYVRTGLAMAAAQPLVGWGAASTPLVSSRFREQTPGVTPPGELLRQLHNLPVNLLAETGVMGLAASLALALVVLLGGAGPAVIAAVVYLVFSLNDYQLDLPAILFPLAMVAALATAETSRTPFEPSPVPRRLALAFLLITASAGAVLFARTAVAHYHYSRGDAARAALWESRCGFYAAQAGRPLDAAALAPDLVPLAAQAGAALVETGQYTRALPWLERAAELDHYNSLAHFHLGRARLRTGDRAGAVAAFSMSLLAQPATVFAEAWREPPERDVYAQSLSLALDRMHELAAFHPQSGPWRRWNELGAYLAGRRDLLPEGPHRVLFFELVDRDLAFNHSLIAFRRSAPPSRISPVVLLLPTPQPRPPAGLGAIEGLPSYRPRHR